MEIFPKKDNLTVNFKLKSKPYYLNPVWKLINTNLLWKWVIFFSQSVKILTITALNCSQLLGSP